MTISYLVSPEKEAVSVGFTGCVTRATLCPLSASHSLALFKRCIACGFSSLLVTQLCPTLCDPMDCSLPGSSCPCDSPGNTGVGCHSLPQGIFPTQGSKLGLLYCRQILYHLSHHQQREEDWKIIKDMDIKQHATEQVMTQRKKRKVNLKYLKTIKN